MYRVIIKYCVFSDDFKIFQTLAFLFFLLVSVCVQLYTHQAGRTPALQKTDRVQIIHKILRKNTIFNEHPVHKMHNQGLPFFGRCRCNDLNMASTQSKPHRPPSQGQADRTQEVTKFPLLAPEANFSATPLSMPTSRRPYLAEIFYPNDLVQNYRFRYLMQTGTCLVINSIDANLANNTNINNVSLQSKLASLLREFPNIGVVNSSGLRLLQIRPCSWGGTSHCYGNTRLVPSRAPGPCSAQRRPRPRMSSRPCWSLASSPGARYRCGQPPYNLSRSHRCSEGILIRAVPAPQPLETPPDSASKSLAG